MPEGDRRAPDASEATVSLCLSNRRPARHSFASVRCCAVLGSHACHNDGCDRIIARVAVVTPGHGRNLYDRVRSVGYGLNCYLTIYLTLISGLHNRIHDLSMYVRQTEVAAL